MDMSKLVCGVWALVALCVVLSCWPTYAQTTQSGVIMEYREELSQRTIDGVEVLVSNANSTVSNKKGKFLLVGKSREYVERDNARRLCSVAYKRREYLRLLTTKLSAQWRREENMHS